MLPKHGLENTVVSLRCKLHLLSRVAGSREYKLVCKCICACKVCQRVKLSASSCGPLQTQTFWQSVGSLRNFCPFCKLHCQSNAYIIKLLRRMRAHTNLSFYLPVDQSQLAHNLATRRNRHCQPSR